MNADAVTWFAFADENLAVAQWALESGYFNACLQNVQQAVEKKSKEHYNHIFKNQPTMNLRAKLQTTTNQM